ncbi:hypothetical protein [Prevotella sp. MA2016]|uniref:hypothetical protein n=1 Tax=Prevotella sp. MA2016 TaxID=1408310 RepID=UPI00048A5C49|nr:hypothetical protein [Prevotella sp. MA2016]
MVNYYNKHLFISKAQLAKLAGVSERTFSRYLSSRLHILERMGVSRKAQLLPPQAVKYVCEDYCIDLPEALQDRRVLQSHELYRKVVRELQLTTFFDGKWTKITEIPPDF